MPRGRKKGTVVTKKTGTTAAPKEVKEQVSETVIDAINPEDIPQEDFKVVKKEVKPSKPVFEFKDRYYYLKGGREPVAHFLKSKRIIWFDPEKGYEREIQFTENQKTPFVDEFKGEVRPARMIFRDGVLQVPKTKVIWQQILSIYHDELNKVYLERDEEQDAMDELTVMELELEAMSLAKNMDITKAEGVVRMKEGISSKEVSSMSVKEIRRTLMLFAKEDPQLVIALAEDDDVEARNIGIKATEQGFLKLTHDKRTFMDKNGRKLFDVPFTEHPYSALTQWFKSDEGLNVYGQLERLIV